MGTTKRDVWECFDGEAESLCTHFEAYHARRCDEGVKVVEGTWWLDDNDNVVREEYGHSWDKPGG